MKGIEKFVEKEPRGLARTLRKITHILTLLLKSDNAAVSFNYGGINFITPKKHWIGNLLVRRGGWEREQIAFFFQNAKDRGADIFLDVGANYGVYSLLAAKTGNFAEIHAIEAHPENYEGMLACFGANSFARIIAPHNIAASDAEGELFLDNRASDDRASDVASVSKNERPDTFAIKAAALDSVFDFSGRNIAVKIDVEGHELSVLRGMANLIRRNNVFMQVEILSGGSSQIHSVLECGLRIIHRINSDFYFVNDKAE